MNDKQYIDAARKLAERILQEGGASPEDRLIYGFRLVTARHPSEKELASLRKGFDRQLASFAAEPAAAEKLLGYGDLPKNANLEPVEYAAWTMMANLLINLDETINK
jgi:hypothetical protein